MENIEIKRKVGRPKGSKNKPGVKTGRPKGITKNKSEIRNINFSLKISKIEQENIKKVLNSKEFKGISQRKVIMNLIEDYIVKNNL